MGFIFSCMFGGRHKVLEFDGNQNATVYYLVNSSKRLWLANKHLEELYEYKNPAVSVKRLDNGPRTWMGLDKGRWFISIADAYVADSEFFPNREFYCYSKSEAYRIKSAAECVSAEIAIAYSGNAHAAYIEERLEKSEHITKETKEWLEDYRKRHEENWQGNR